MDVWKGASDDTPSVSTLVATNQEQTLLHFGQKIIRVYREETIYQESQLRFV